VADCKFAEELRSYCRRHSEHCHLVTRVRVPGHCSVQVSGTIG
jgi:hypothetical protein